MELLGIIDIPTWLLILLGIGLTLYLYSSYKQSVFRRLSIPGPKPIPYLGLMISFFKKSITEIDIELHEKYGNVVGTYFGNHPTMLVYDPEMIKVICVKEFPKFINRPELIKSSKIYESMISFSKGDHWKYLRSTLSPTFSSGKLKNMQPIIQRCTDTLVEHMREQAEKCKCTEMKDSLGAYTMDVTCSTAFGINVDSQKDPNNPYVIHAKSASKFSPFTLWFLFVIFFPDLSWMASSVNPFPKDLMEFFLKATKKAIEERQMEGSEYKDFLQLMMNAHKDNSPKEDLTDDQLDFKGYKNRGMTEDEIMMNALLFFITGYETTSSTITWTLFTLATNMDCQKRLLQEIDDLVGKEKPSQNTICTMEYLDMVISETLRLYPSGVRTNRAADEDVVVCGQKIPKGMDVAFPIFAIHRDPKYWPDPLKFDPERFSPENKKNINPYAYLPFGIGPRNCIAKRLALIEAKTAIICLLQNFRFVTGPETVIPPKFAKSTFLSPEKGMWLKTEIRD